MTGATPRALPRYTHIYAHDIIVVPFFAGVGYRSHFGVQSPPTPQDHSILPTGEMHQVPESVLKFAATPTPWKLAEGLSPLLRVLVAAYLRFRGLRSPLLLLQTAAWVFLL